jgi:hypothetical protein
MESALGKVDVKVALQDWAVRDRRDTSCAVDPDRH